MEAIDIYSKLMCHLLHVDEALGKPHVWHNDLHSANIFVDPLNPTKITGIIDWQNIQIRPLYFQARQPFFIDHPGPRLRGLERPAFPKRDANADPAAHGGATTLYFQQSLCVLYKTLIHKQSPAIHRCFEFQESPAFDMLLLARNLLVDGEAAYIAQAVAMERIWPTLSCTQAVQFPLTFSEEDVMRAEKDAENASRGMQLLQAVRVSMGELFPERGMVRHEQYDEAKDALRQLNEQMIGQYARNEEEIKMLEDVWPCDV